MSCKRFAKYYYVISKQITIQSRTFQQNRIVVNDYRMNRSPF